MDDARDLPASDIWRHPAALTHLSVSQYLRWMIDDFSIVEDRMIIRGWFISPFHPAEAARFMINQHESVSPDTLYSTEELQYLLSNLPGSAFRFSITRAVPADQQFLSIAFLPSGHKDSAAVDTSAWYLLNPAQEDDPLPMGDNMFRVIATGDSLLFRLGGSTTANRIDAYLARAHGRPLAKFDRVLDWGCGCGRITRYLKKLGCQNVHGVDVDSVNVDWCQANLPDVTVNLIDLDPPLPFPDEYFDLVIGVSIFTHLREPSQFSWLAELARVLKPGGLVMVTVMSEGQIALAGGSVEMIENLDRRGFMITEDNNQLHLGGDEENYYVNTYHTAEYIYSNWAKYLTIVDIIPFMGLHQQAVVLRR